MKRALILYARYGGGHASAARSIQDYLAKHADGVEAEAVDFMAYLSKAIDKLSVAAYEEVVRKAPALWGTVYAHTENGGGALSRIGAETIKLMAYRLRSLIEETAPECIICTHPFASQMCAYLKREGRLTGVRLATVLTDFAVHDQWLIGSEQIDRFFVAHAEMRDQMIQRGIPAEKVFDTGIPIGEQFVRNFDTDALRQEFHLQKDKPTILFFAGGMNGLCSEQVMQAFTDMARYLEGVQILAVAGKNLELFETLCGIVRRYKREDEIQVMHFTLRVAELMRVSDLVISKPGGLTTSECLSCGLPMILLSPIPGQEEKNAEYLVRHRLACLIRKEDNPIGVIFQVVKNPALLEQLRSSARRFAGNFSTMQICSILYPGCELPY